MAERWEAIISRADDFKTLFSNIAIDNASTIATRYGEITRALNLQFRDTVDEAIEANEELQLYVERLEQDAHDEEVSAERLVDEIEDFLKDR